MPSPVHAPHSILTFSPPHPVDGAAVHALVANCPPLDPNSMYCNLLQCDHFRDTCLCARDGEQLAGFVSGYRIPSRSSHLFIWQVAVDARYRGQGVGLRLLQKLLRQPGCKGVNRLETTITPENSASWALFRKLAVGLDAEVSETELYQKDRHFGGAHESEIRLIISPLPPSSPKPQTSTDPETRT